MHAFYAVRRSHDIFTPGGAINLRNLGNLFCCDRRYLPLPSKLHPLIPLLMQNTSMVSLDGGSACKVDDVTALPSHIQDGGYALLRQRYDNNKMAAICYSTSSTVQS